MNPIAPRVIHPYLAAAANAPSETTTTPPLPVDVVSTDTPVPAWVGFSAGAMALLSLATVAPAANAAGVTSSTASISSTINAPAVDAATLPDLDGATTALRGLDGGTLSVSSMSSWRRGEHDGWRTDIGHSNDSSDYLQPIMRERDRVPGMARQDDDGWTSGFRVDAVKTAGDHQTVVSVRYDMVTERGGWTHDPAWGGRRQDFVQFTVQENARVPISADGRTRLLGGLGIGAQAIGPMGGYDIQNGWHKLGWFGGRVGPENGLQTNYTTDGVVASPLLTGGVGLERELDPATDTVVRGTLTGNLAAGQGPSSVRAGVALSGYPTSWLRAEVGAHVDSVHNQGAALDYMHMDGTRAGWHVRLEGASNRYVTPFLHIEQGGFTNDTNYVIGISIPIGEGGSRPWLNPIHR